MKRELGGPVMALRPIWQKKYEEVEEEQEEGC